MTISRKLITIQTPPAQPGFLGSGHVARPVIQVNFSESDPFILLMDDQLDKKDNVPVGGPHPHAGFETVSLLLEGEIGDSSHKMKGGDFQIMTAGSGIIHTETIQEKTRLRLLQLWLNLPKKERWTKPRLQDLTSEKVPSLSENGMMLKVYSGTLGGLTSPVKNHVPLIIADIQLQPESNTTLHLPAFYTAFLYAIEGSMAVGEEAMLLAQDQVGWLDRYPDQTQSALPLKGGVAGGRVVLYAGAPQHDPIVSHGPFIGDTQDDIRRLYRAYRAGEMSHIATVPETQRLIW